MGDLLRVKLPDDGPFGEAWVLSDREDHASVVAEGAHAGRTIRELMEQFPTEILGTLATRFRRFPLLLKFLDVKKMLSVQVHPSNAETELIPPGETGKTEAWVVLEADQDSRVYAGLKPDVSAADLRDAINTGSVADQLSSFTPNVGDAVFLKAGTVHALGRDIVVFEVQQNSDVTFRLFDWDHIDEKTGKPRPLQVDQALACIDYREGPVGPVTPAIEGTTSSARERLFACEHFSLWRRSGQSPFIVGNRDRARVVTCIDGLGHVEHDGTKYDLNTGDVMLLPAVVGACSFEPSGRVTLLEVALPE